jgi:hypothetical protein
MDHLKTWNEQYTNKYLYLYADFTGLHNSLRVISYTVFRLREFML